MKKETIIGIVLAIMAVWVIGFTAPKIYQIYKDKNITETVKSDTIILKDTLFLERTAIDTLPKTVYQTVVEHDTVYRVNGDSIEAQPRIIVLKKKLYRKPLNWKDRILYHYNTQHK